MSFEKKLMSAAGLLAATAIVAGLPACTEDGTGDALTTSTPTATSVAPESPSGELPPGSTRRMIRELEMLETQLRDDIGRVVARADDAGAVATGDVRRLRRRLLERLDDVQKRLDRLTAKS